MTRQRERYHLITLHYISALCLEVTPSPWRMPRGAQDLCLSSWVLEMWKVPRLEMDDVLAQKRTQLNSSHHMSMNLTQTTTSQIEFSAEGL